MKINTLLKNKILFYPLFIIFLMIVVLFILKNEFQNLILLILTYVSTCYISNNNNIRLGISILVLSLFSIPKKSFWPWKERETFKESATANKSKTKKDKTTKSKKKGEKNKSKKKGEISDSEISSMAKNLHGELKTLNGLVNDPKQMSMELKKQGIKNVDNKIIKEKQEELKQHMSDITPFIEKTEKLLEMFKSSGLINLVDKFSHLMPQNMIS